MSIFQEIQTKKSISPDVIGPAKTTRLLLRLLRASQPVSRIELAQRLGVNRSTVTDVFKPLINAGLIREEPVTIDENSSTLGRPRIALTFNDDNDFFVGLNLGVRRSQIGLTTLSGEILAETEFETPADADEAVESAKAAIEKLCAPVTDRKLKVIGVSVPGPADAARRQLLYAPHLGWSHVAIADKLESLKLNSSQKPFEKIPVIVDNDATAAAMYEARIKLRDTNAGLLNDFILVRSGTGIGVGLVLDSEVYRGTGGGTGIAGEFGHMIIVAGGKPCVCGNRGCWERYASAGSAAALYTGERTQLGNAKPPRFVEIVERASAGEIRARRTLEKIGEYLGIGIGNVIMGIGIPRVIVSGRLVYGWEFIKEPLREAVSKSIVGRISGWTVECGEPKGAALGGAFEIAVHEFLMRSFTV